jgi:hypothetical protein
MGVVFVGRQSQSLKTTNVRLQEDVRREDHVQDHHLVHPQKIVQDQKRDRAKLQKEVNLEVQENQEVNHRKEVLRVQKMREVLHRDLRENQEVLMIVQKVGHLMAAIKIMNSF